VSSPRRLCFKGVEAMKIVILGFLLTRVLEWVDFAIFGKNGVRVFSMVKNCDFGVFTLDTRPPAM
jgi:hypothetical protein